MSLTFRHRTPEKKLQNGEQQEAERRPWDRVPKRE
jgi:hypothetical protein